MKKSQLQTVIERLEGEINVSQLALDAKKDILRGLKATAQPKKPAKAKVEQGVSQEV